VANLVNSTPESSAVQERADLIGAPSEVDDDGRFGRVLPFLTIEAPLSAVQELASIYQKRDRAPIFHTTSSG
jgi:hypothetical protein